MLTYFVEKMGEKMELAGFFCGRGETGAGGAVWNIQRLCCLIFVIAIAVLSVDKYCC